MSDVFGIIGYIFIAVLSFKLGMHYQWFPDPASALILSAIWPLALEAFLGMKFFFYILMGSSIVIDFIMGAKP